MHNSLTRLQNTFSFFTTVVFTLGILIALSDLLAPRTPSGTIKVENLSVTKGRVHYYSPKKEEYASIKFSLDADLSSLITWNTKQLFVYVTAEWPDSPGSNATNSAVIWDSIITSPSSDHLANVGPATMKKLRRSAAGKSIDPSRGILKLRNQRPKYQITHPSGKVAQVSDVKLKLHYNVQPWVGLLTWNQERAYGKWEAMKGGVSKLFDFPALKNKN
ncbi:putative signal peptidase subunit protein [Scedosporium apiospermum]|uniref:Signal peptidase subunit 3 n=1 Tax=Pseudallescheria apiosperma TaxID=563466 RepID=A0A084FXZ6_PSEDA|nr:putative signal peptidase subunit protein [Scedosporium apiospermum]KEZ39958.1 putative signal peptidase subunit protein [Scedosporium apiospermum]